MLRGNQLIQVAVVALRLAEKVAAQREHDRNVTPPIRRSIAAVPGLTVETALVGHLMPTADPTGPHWPRWQAAMGEGFGYAPEQFRKWGAASCSDFGWVQATGMQEILLTGLGRPYSRIHAPGEFTTLTDIIALAKSVLAYLSAEFRPDLSPEAAASR